MCRNKKIFLKKNLYTNCKSPKKKEEEERRKKKKEATLKFGLHIWFVYSRKKKENWVLTEVLEVPSLNA